MAKVDQQWVPAARPTGAAEYLLEARTEPYLLKVGDGYVRVKVVGAVPEPTKASGPKQPILPGSVILPRAGARRRGLS